MRIHAGSVRDSPEGRIGVGNAEARENLTFALLHRLGILVARVVETEQMQGAVDREMRKVALKRLVLVLGLAPNCLQREHHVAEKFRIAWR